MNILITGASKGIGKALIKSFAKTRPHKIRINYFALGAEETEMFSETFPGEIAPIRLYEIATYIPDFALEKWKYINGKIIEIAL